MNKKDNLSLVIHKKGDLRLEQRPIPNPGKNEVMIAIHSVGICGSDVHFWHSGHLGDYEITEPIVLGHETSGKVIKLGEGVKTLKVGDRVAMEVGIPCRICELCKTGHYNICPDIKFAATNIDGTMTRYYVLPEDLCFKLPEHVNFHEGAMVEPVAVAVASLMRGKVGMGDVMLVTGSGPIGLMTLMTAKAIGVNKVCVTDINAHRLATAKRLGADAVIQSNNSQNVEELARLVEQSLGCKPSVTIECSGTEAGVRLGIAATKLCGRLVMVGIGPVEMKVPLIIAAMKELSIIGCFRYCNAYPIALDLVASGKVDVKQIITHQFKLEDSVEAFKVAKEARDGAIKVIINCSEQ